MLNNASLYKLITESVREILSEKKKLTYVTSEKKPDPLHHLGGGGQKKSGVGKGEWKGKDKKGGDKKFGKGDGSDKGVKKSVENMKSYDNDDCCEEDEWMEVDEEMNDLNEDEYCEGDEEEEEKGDKKGKKDFNFFKKGGKSKK